MLFHKAECAFTSPKAADLLEEAEGLTARPWSGRETNSRKRSNSNSHPWGTKMVIYGKGMSW